MRAVVFPGQGAQCIGMAGDLFDRYAQLVAQADEVLGFSLRALCLEDPVRLSATRYTQPALFVVCYLRYLDYELEHGPPAILAGHSIGEYAALAAANALGFVDALKLVDSRACTMANVDGGAMAALVGPDREAVRALVADFSAGGLEIANENSPTQTVVAGLAKDVTGFIDFCKNRGVRAVRLNVSGAFHSSHMRPAADRFAAVLAATQFVSPRIPVVSNVTARLHDRDPGRAMAMHLYSPVLWQRSVDFMLDSGVTSFVEIGPRSVLTPLIEEIQGARRSRGKPVAAETPQTATALVPPLAASMLGPLRCHGAIADVLGWFARQPGDIVLDAGQCATHGLRLVRDGLAQAGIHPSRLSLYIEVGNSPGKEIAQALECLQVLGACRVVLGKVSDPCHDLRPWFDAKHGSPGLRLMMLCNCLAAAHRLLKVPGWSERLEAVCLDGACWADTGVSLVNALQALGPLLHGSAVSVGARPAGISPGDTALLRKAGAQFILSAGPYALVDDVAAPSGQRVRAPAWVGPDGWSPEFASTSALATAAPCKQSLEFLAGLYRAPPREPGRLHRHYLELMAQLAAEELPCVVAPPPLDASPRGARRYLRETMRLVHQAMAQASAAGVTHANEDTALAEQWWRETHDPTAERLYAWIWAEQRETDIFLINGRSCDPSQ